MSAPAGRTSLKVVDLPAPFGYDEAKNLAALYDEINMVRGAKSPNFRQFLRFNHRFAGGAFNRMRS